MADFDDVDFDDPRPSRMRMMLACGGAAAGAIRCWLGALRSGDHDPGQCAVPAIRPASGTDLRQQAATGRPPASHSLTAADTAVPRARPADPMAKPAPARPRAMCSPTSSASSPGAASTMARPTASTARRPTPRSATSSRPPGLRASAEPNDALLQAIVALTTSRRSLPQRRPASTIRSPICLRADPKVWRCSAHSPSYGYGQIKPTGVYDPETRAAIERFERDRKLPVTGQISSGSPASSRALTGRPLDVALRSRCYDDVNARDDARA